MTIEKYVLTEKDGSWSSDEFDSLIEAREAAAHSGEVAIVALVYEFSDSELVEVWRNGRKTSEETWPG